MSVQPLPTEFPRFAESFRVYIDDKYGWRMLTSEWMHALGAGRHLEDLKTLATAGRIGVICSTGPVEAHGRDGRRFWYGDADYPVLYWHWRPGAETWEWPADEFLLKWSERHKYKPSLGLIKCPRNQEFRG